MAEEERVAIRSVRCPSCGDHPERFIEVWEGMTMVFDCYGDSRPADGILQCDGAPCRVRAECGCGVKWTLRGVSQIGDIDLLSLGGSS